MITVIFYNPQQQQLRLQFEGGEVYDYYLVHAEEARHAEVALAAHDQNFFRKSIKGVYPSRRVA